MDTTIFKQEKYLLFALLMALLALSLEHRLIGSGQMLALLTTGVLVFAILMASLRVAHHAEVLAEKYGEPYGTMILTISAVLVEVVILVVMLSHNPSPTLLRDTIYSAVMLDLNGILGFCAIIGGLKYGEQSYNVDSGNTYIVMILTAMGVSMIVPEFIAAVHWQTYSIFTIAIMILMYGIFLRLQVGQHSYFFSYAYAQHPHDAELGQPHHTQSSAKQSAALLVAGIVIIGVLAEVMSKSFDIGLAGMGMPPITAALLVAVMSASPEILTCVRAALANKMQPVVNIALGASLSTVILTVPVVGLLALLNNTPIEMAMTPIQTVMIFLTLMVASINLHDGETNAIEGMTHFVLFLTFIMLSFLGV